MRTDNDIKRDIETELRWSPRLDDTNIAVKVMDGVVTLMGFVRRYSDRYEAEIAAKRIAGVAGIANDIEVRFVSAEERSDVEIARSAAAAIKLQLPNAWQNVKALVDEGRLTLEGEVPWNYQRVQVESAVRALLGVKTVSNMISIKPPVVPGEIKLRIEDAFRRSAQIDANRITVEADGGEITLKGKVRSWAEREEAQETAWSAPGVRMVRNQIAVGM